MSLLLSRKEKEALVIKLAKEDKATREIVKIIHTSLPDIGKIIGRDTGDAENSQKDKEKEKQQQKSNRIMLKHFKRSEKRKVSLKL